MQRRGCMWYNIDDQRPFVSKNLVMTSKAAVALWWKLKLWLAFGCRYGVNFAFFQMVRAGSSKIPAHSPSQMILKLWVSNLRTMRNFNNIGYSLVCFSSDGHYSCARLVKMFILGIKRWLTCSSLEITSIKISISNGEEFTNCKSLFGFLGVRGRRSVVKWILKVSIDIRSVRTCTVR